MGQIQKEDLLKIILGHLKECCVSAARMMQTDTRRFLNMGAVAKLIDRYMSGWWKILLPKKILAFFDGFCRLVKIYHVYHAAHDEMNGFPKKLKRKRRHKRTKDLRHVDLGCVGFPSHRRLMHEHLPFKKHRSEDTWIINWTAWIWIDFTSTTGIQMVSFTPIGDFKHFSCHFYGLG